MTSQTFCIYHGDRTLHGTAETQLSPKSACSLPYAIFSEIESNDRTSAGAVNSLISALHSQYATLPSLDSEEALIRLCRYCNEHAAALTGKPPAWLKKLSLAIAIFDQNRVSLAIAGDTMRGFLARKQRVVDILTSSDGGTPRGTPRKNPQPKTAPKGGKAVLFSSFIQGSIAPGDRMLFCCRHLFDYFSYEKIKQLLIARPIEETAELIAQMLTKLPGNVGVCGGLLSPIPEPLHEIAAAPPLAPARLTPPVLTQSPRRNKAAPPPLLPQSFPAASAHAPRHQPVSHAVPSPIHPDASNRIISFIRPLTERATRVASGLYSHTTRVVHRALQTVRATVGTRVKAAEQAVFPDKTVPPPAGSVPAPRWRVVLNRIITRFQRLPRASKYLFIASFLLALLFIESVVSIANEKVRERERSAFAAQSQRVASAQAEAEAALIYGDEEKARIAILSADRILDGLTAPDNETRSSLAMLSASVQRMYDQVFHVTAVTPEPVIDLNQIVEDVAPPAPGGLIGPYQNKYIVYNTNNPTVFIFDPEEQLITISSSDAPMLERFVRGTLGDNGRAYLLSPGGLSRYDIAANSITPLTSDLAAANLTDIATFGSRLYALNRVSGAITRHTLGTGSLGTGSLWLADDVTLPGATALAIDGNVYVADAAGTLRKFSAGREVAFTNPTLDPPLEAPARLIASDAGLLVLEPSHERIIILDQHGVLARQLTSESFSRLVDVAYDETNRTLYALIGSIIYKIPYP